MPDYDCENHVSEKLDYTPVLSKYFTSFSGVCRRYEFREAFWRVLLFSALYGVVYVIFAFVVLPALLMPLSLGISVEVEIIWVTLIFFSLFWLKNVGIPWFRVYSKRLHAFGKSATYWLLIPNAVIDLIQIILEIGGAGLPLIVGLIHLGYAIYLFCLCFFARAEIDAPVVANPAREALLERLKKKNADVRTRKTIKSVQSAVPIVSTVRGEPVDTSAAPPKRSFLFIVVIILVLYGSAYSVYHYIQSQSEDRISEDFAQAELIREVNEKNKKTAQDKLKAMGITDYDKAVMEHYDNPEKLQLLITAGGNVNVTDEYGETPLYWAANSGHTECVKLLVSAPSFDGSGWNALSVAVFGNDSKKIKQLIQTGMRVNSEDIYGTTPLFWAAQMGAVECVQQLLSAPGIDVNKAGKYGYTPLYRAANSGHAECVKLLLAAPGIDVNRADEWGRTPLYKAVYEGHTEVVKLLLAAPGIDVNKALEYGETPLYRAAYGGHTEVVKLLLAAPSIDVYKADKDGRTPFITAAYKGHTEVVKLLLAIPGIDVNKTNKYGWTLLSTAAHGGHTEVVKLLLAIPGIDVNKADTSDRTPLYKAAHEGRAEVVKLLLVAPGIDVNKADKSGQTPLYKAAQEGRAEVVKLLLAAPGIDVNKANNIGWTPLGWAVKRGYSEIVKLLKAAGAKK